MFFLTILDEYQQYFEYRLPKLSIMVHLGNKCKPEAFNLQFNIQTFI